MRLLNYTELLAVRNALLIFVLTLALSGCASSVELMSALNRENLPPAPTTPGAVVTDTQICIPHAEAAELLLWIEHAEAVCR